MRHLTFIELSFGVIALLLLALCVVNPLGGSRQLVGILAGAALGVALVSLWTAERWRRQVWREVRKLGNWSRD